MWNRDGQPARTETELRDALATLERHAPEPDEVLSVLPASSVRRRRPVLTGGGLAMAAGTAAAALAIAMTSVNPGAMPVAHHARLAASVVRSVAEASKTAMASSGHVIVTYSDVDKGTLTGSGTLNITFSGENFNSVSSQPGMQAFTERVVGGQIYTFGAPPPGGKLQWYHSVNATDPGQEVIPDPRKLLYSLRPGAGFIVLGWQSLSGVRVEHLRATHPEEVPPSMVALWAKLRYYKLTGLDIWIDAKSIVRQMAMQFQDPGLAATQGGGQRFLVRFLDIGLVQPITAPSHYANQRTYG